jgi:hypothetical protein
VTGWNLSINSKNPFLSQKTQALLFIWNLSLTKKGISPIRIVTDISQQVYFEELSCGIYECDGFVVNGYTVFDPVL